MHGCPLPPADLQAALLLPSKMVPHPRRRPVIVLLFAVPGPFAAKEPDASHPQLQVHLGAVDQFRNDDKALSSQERLRRHHLPSMARPREPSRLELIPGVVSARRVASTGTTVKNRPSSVP